MHCRDGDKYIRQLSRIEDGLDCSGAGPRRAQFTWRLFATSQPAVIRLTLVAIGLFPTLQYLSLYHLPLSHSSIILPLNPRRSLYSRGCVS